MHSTVKNLVQDAFKKFDIGVMNYGVLQEIIAERSKACDDLALLSELPDTEPPQLLKAFRQSRSQLRQDVFALAELDFKRGGFFVEFGATNGVNISNTVLLEREFGWNGILAEPARRWHEDLARNRSCSIETRCVWRESDSTLTFNEADSGEFSTIETYNSSDLHFEARKHGKTYTVQTISLEDLLDKYKAPKVIDYLSIDTEGSEYEILSGFNFDKYQFRMITCEHNFGPQREKIAALLTKNGYALKYERFSKFDDWYVRAGTA